MAHGVIVVYVYTPYAISLQRLDVGDLYNRAGNATGRWIQPQHLLHDHFHTGVPVRDVVIPARVRLRKERGEHRAYIAAIVVQRDRHRDHPPERLVHRNDKLDRIRVRRQPAMEADVDLSKHMWRDLGGSLGHGP